MIILNGGSTRKDNVDDRYGNFGREEEEDYAAVFLWYLTELHSNRLHLETIVQQQKDKWYAPILPDFTNADGLKNWDIF